MRTPRMISVVGCHAEGEVGDVIVGGVLPPPGATMCEKMRAMERDFDHIRRLLICEPRGSVARHVNLIVPPTRADCDAGVIIMEPTEYLPMSGSNTDVHRDGAAGDRHGADAGAGDRAAARHAGRAGGCRRASAATANAVSVKFGERAGFVDKLDAPLEVEGRGTITVDIAYGGMFYAIVDAPALGFEIAPRRGARAGGAGREDPRGGARAADVVHPENPEIAGVSIVQLDGPFDGPAKSSRNTCIVAPGRSDRSPTGTGTSARMAVLHARGQLKVGDGMIHELIIGSRFKGRIAGETDDRRHARRSYDHQGPRVDHRLSPLSRRSDRSLARRLCRGRHLGHIDGDAAGVRAGGKRLTVHVARRRAAFSCV